MNFYDGHSLVTYLLKPETIAGSMKISDFTYFSVKIDLTNEIFLFFQNSGKSKKRKTKTIDKFINTIM